jgi:hypothetical protein
MNRKEIDRAEKAERDRTEKARREKDKSDRKIRDKAEKDRKEKDKSDKKLQDKAEKIRREKDRSDRKIQVSDRASKFKGFLDATNEKSKGCCEPCNYQARTSNGEYLPCKMGHKDSGPNKEICADCSFPQYHPKR